jgi:hypothetical protein
MTDRLVAALQWLMVAAIVAWLCSGCGDHRKNPVGPERVPQAHYRNCAKRCTALGFGPGKVHVRRGP